MEPSELLDLLKGSTGAASDYAVAKKLELTTSGVSSWRRNVSFPDNDLCLLIAPIVGISPAVLLLHAAIWRAKSKTERKCWEETLESVSQHKT